MSFRGPSYKTIARQYGSRLKIRDQELMQWFHLTWGGIKPNIYIFYTFKMFKFLIFQCDRELESYI